ncbi:hypothetical protein MJ575_07160 [Klebsiella pneumoniae]|nr:hypothetical protein MJ575_07160 [Klebsiella pneumoniae]
MGITKIHTRMACGLSGTQFLHLFLWPRTRLQPRAFQGMPADFIKGVDISTLLDAEKHGATFYDQNNQRKDPIDGKRTRLTKALPVCGWIRNRRAARTMAEVE